jgi:hypothetical protein
MHGLKLSILIGCTSYAINILINNFLLVFFDTKSSIEGSQSNNTSKKKK